MKHYTNLNRIQKLKDEEVLTSTVQRVVSTGWLAGISKIVLGLIVSDKLVVVVAETEKQGAAKYHPESDQLLQCNIT